MPAPEVACEGLLVDFGGVLTTNIWISFQAFCRAEGLDPGAVKDAFRADGAGLRLLRALETGELDDAEFERRFGALLGVEPTDLVARLFAGLGPDEAMIAAVTAVKGAGVPTGLISNSVSCALQLAATSRATPWILRQSARFGVSSTSIAWSSSSR